MKEKFLESLARFIIRNARLIVVLSIVSTLICGFYSFKYLKIDSDQDHMISPQKEYHQRYLNFLNKFGDTEYIFVVFEINPDNKIHSLVAIDELASTLKQNPAFFPYVSYRENIDFAKNHELQLIPQKEFQDLQNFSTLLPVEKIANIQNEAEFIMTIDHLINKLSKTNSGNTDQSFDFLTNVISQTLHLYQNPDFPFSLDTFLDQTSLRNKGYYASESDKLLFLKILPQKDYATSSVIEKPLQFIRHNITNLQKKYPDLVIGVTGRPVLQADEIESSGQDSLYACIGSIVGVLLLYLYYLKNLKKPLLIMLALLASIAWTGGFITLTIGRLNLLSMVFGIILVGIGVDYGMHFLLRFLKHQKTGLNPDESLILTMRQVGDSIITGATATTLAFFSAFFCDFLGLKELGFISGSGVLLCLISQLITFPALLYLYGCKPIESFKLNLPLEKLWKFFFLRPKLTLSVTLIATILLLPLSFKVIFENNLLKLQDPNLESVKWELKILQDSGLTTYFAALTTKSLDELLQKKKQIETLPSVDSTESIYSIIPTGDPQRDDLFKTLNNALESINSNIWQTSTQTEFNQTIDPLLKHLEALQEKAFTAGLTDGVKGIDQLLIQLGEIKKVRNLASVETIASTNNKLANFKKDLLDSLKSRLIIAPLTLKDIPTSIQNRYVHNGEYVLYIYPKKNIWDWDELTSFLGELRSVDPLVTGAPVSVYESAIRMKRGFYLVGGITTIIVILLLFFELGNIFQTTLSIIPLGIGLAWLSIWMAVSGISLNLGNFFALPILIGLGIDNGVHLIHRYRETNDPWDMIVTVAPSIILSTLTTVIGFGALSFVRHRGLASFGLIMTLGSLTCLMSALIVVPCLLQLKNSKGNS